MYDIDLPCVYGDETPIPREYLDKLIEVIDREEIFLVLEPGDLLLVDNFTVSHGREPWQGDRRVLVSMWDGAHKIAAY
jgi:alpha-ketoglutarate-dependent taurine dioxygenase